MAQQDLSIGGSLYAISFADDISLADDASQALDLVGYNGGTIMVKYITTAGAVYTGNFTIHRIDDTLTIPDPDNTTDFDNADTDGKFDLWVDSDVVYLRNRTGATVTANVSGLISK